MHAGQTGLDPDSHVENGWRGYPRLPQTTRIVDTMLSSRLESTKDICMIKMMYSVPFLSSIGVIKKKKKKQSSASGLEDV